MNKKILGIIITAIICISLIAGGIIISGSVREESSEVVTETTISETSVDDPEYGDDSGISFETENTRVYTDAVPGQTDDNNSTEITVRTNEPAGNNIYVEEDNIISGGNFSWR